MAKPTQTVEVFRCWDDRTWDTAFVEIPADTAAEDVEETAVHAAYEDLRNSADLPFFIGIYCFGEEDSEDDQDDHEREAP